MAQVGLQGWWLAFVSPWTMDVKRPRPGLVGVAPLHSVAWKLCGIMWFSIHRCWRTGAGVSREIDDIHCKCCWEVHPTLNFQLVNGTHCRTCEIENVGQICKASLQCL